MNNANLVVKDVYYVRILLTVKYVEMVSILTPWEFAKSAQDNVNLVMKMLNAQNMKVEKLCMKDLLLIVDRDAKIVI